MMYNIIDNYLSETEFSYVYNTIHNIDFNWCLWKKANYNSNEDNHFQFAHSFVNYKKECYKTSSKLPILIMKRIAKKEKKQLIISKAKANLFLKNNNHVKLGFHKDIEDDTFLKTLILYLEDSNGYTEFENGEKIMSVKNRALIFNAHSIHQTVTQTDTMFRTNVNINFYYA